MVSLDLDRLGRWAMGFGVVAGAIIISMIIVFLVIFLGDACLAILTGHGPWSISPAGEVINAAGCQT